jgi:hypothetical protein
MPQSSSSDDLEKATPTAKNSSKSQCRPTISAIDIHFDGRAKRIEQYPRSLRKDETEYIASLPPLTPKCARIYLKEEDCRAREKFDIQGANILKLCNQQSQLWLRVFQERLKLSLDLFQSTIARVLENSGVDRWWSIHKADRFDIWDLRNLFEDQEQASQGFLVQLDMEASQVHERAILASSEDASPTRRSLYAGRFSGDTVFWEKYAAFKVCHSEVEDAFEGENYTAAIVLSFTDVKTVHCFFPALSYAVLPEKLSDEYVFPLLIQFERMLCSDNTSVPSDIEYSSTAKLYITLDYLRCVTLSWLNFLKSVNHASSPKELTQRQHNNDVLVTAALQTAVDDLKACVSYILDRTTIPYDSISAGQPVPQMTSKSSSRKYLLIAQDLRAQVDYLSRRSTSLREHSQRLLEIDNSASSNSQAQSAGRLTVIASIFLPLTLAASLLAMNVPAASIGRLWYDFAGMVICIALICFASYTAYGKLQAGNQDDRSFIGSWHSFGASSDQDPLLLTASTSSAIWTFLKWGFLAVIAASFLAGMFNTLDLARDILKIGLPILAVLLVMNIVAPITKLILFLRDWDNIPDFAEKMSKTDQGDVLSPDPTFVPVLSKRSYNKNWRTLLESFVVVYHNSQTNKPASPEQPMVSLVQHLFQEVEKLSDLGLLDNSEKKNK